MARVENDSEIVKEPESNCFRGVEKEKVLERREMTKWEDEVKKKRLI